MIFYSELDNHLRNKNNVEIDLSNYFTKSKLEHATGVDFIALKAEVDKLDINKLINVPTSLNNLRTKVYDLDVGKLKTLSVDLKKVWCSRELNELEKKIPDTTTLIDINQYNSDKEIFQKKMKMLWFSTTIVV